MRAKVTNNSRANQGVYTDDGLVHLEPGQTLTLVIADDYVGRVKKLPFLDVVPAGTKAAENKADPDALPRNVPTLRSIAKAEEIDLGEAKSANDIIAAIEAARAAKADAAAE